MTCRVDSIAVWTSLLQKCDFVFIVRFAVLTDACHHFCPFFAGLFSSRLLPSARFSCIVLAICLLPSSLRMFGKQSHVEALIGRGPVSGGNVVALG